ncbi:MAG TPA: 2-amino-4-hydroxy-6-hydroxymethyldihydropteridine diphosphokinase [Kiritimatiellia bacterium]|nr:2-amino-4-hydroxy-6-hydroxymethyldihydropteridine diphosphokinase [Kiritimatiellia bacterium]
MEVGLSLGSCLGDRLAYLSMARAVISALPGVTVVAASPVYETEPVGVKPEYAGLPYLNAVLVVETDLTPETLRECLAEIEEAAGRVRNADKYAPRTLDIDLLYAGNLQQKSETLTVPHPRWAQRRFVVQPLADVRPDFVVPGSVETVAQRLSELPLSPAVRLVETDW